MQDRQYDNRTFKQYGAVAFDEGLAHILTRFTGEGGQRDRRKCRIYRTEKIARTRSLSE